MAIYHCSVKCVKRSEGRSATAAAAYRSGERIVDERTGEIHDYTRRSGVESTELVFPDHVTTRPDREKLWNTAEKAETRKNAQVAREVEIALPDELTADQRRELAVDFARQLAERYNVAADVCIHQPGKEGDQRNHHAHILLTTRTIEADGTLGKKTRILDDQKSGPAEIQKIREMWAQVCNASLEHAGHSERIDHRSLREQGEERQATKHQGPAVTAIERKNVAAVIRREHKDQRLEHIYSLDEYTQQRRAEGNIPAVTRIGELNQAIRELERLEAKRPKPKPPQQQQQRSRNVERQITELHIARGFTENDLRNLRLRYITANGQRRYAGILLYSPRSAGHVPEEVRSVHGTTKLRQQEPTPQRAAERPQENEGPLPGTLAYYAARRAAAQERAQAQVAAQPVKPPPEPPRQPTSAELRAELDRIEAEIERLQPRFPGDAPQVRRAIREHESIKPIHRQQDVEVFHLTREVESLNRQVEAHPIKSRLDGSADELKQKKKQLEEENKKLEELQRRLKESEQAKDKAILDEQRKIAAEQTPERTARLKSLEKRADGLRGELRAARERERKQERQQDRERDDDDFSR